MKKKLVWSLILALSVSFIFPSIASASTEVTNETDSLITPYAYAVNVVDQFKQDYRYDGPVGWGGLYGFTYRTLNVHSGYTQTGYKELSRNTNIFRTQYNFQYTYSIY